MTIPWQHKRVVAPGDYRDDQIFWVRIGALRPTPGFKGPALFGPMRPPQKHTYPAWLVTPIGGHHYRIEDGHHRYGVLLRSGYKGEVPCLIFRRPTTPSTHQRPRHRRSSDDRRT